MPKKEEHKIVPKFVSIRKDQDKWLREHKFVNFSGFVQEELDRFIKRLGGEKE